MNASISFSFNLLSHVSDVRILCRLGDADVAFLAGAKYRKTDKSEMMGVTTVFSAAGVDKKEFLDHIGIH